MLKLCITQCQNILDGLMPITFLQYCSFGRRLEPGIGIDLPIQMGVVLNCRVNVSVGPQEDRMMTSGRHTVADIYCNCCQQLVGWKYVLFTYTHQLLDASIMWLGYLRSCLTQFFDFGRNQPMKRARSTRRENSFLSGKPITFIPVTSSELRKLWGNSPSSCVCKSCWGF